jgi:hypothetical protein
MIVIATREHLRDEFIMADEAFALSPISARATQPREEDYDAISEAFMETSRGRWFLGEYAKRNRNADTRMVLDAIARIEESMAAQRQPVAEPDNGLAEALAAIRRAVDEGRTAAFAAVDNLALEESLAPIRKGTRVIQEIAWRWREIGADSRICDLLDSQAGAIEGACGQIASADPHAALSAAFEVIERQLVEFGGSESDIASPQAAGEASFSQVAEEEAAAPASHSPSPAPSNELPAAVHSAVEITDAAEASEAVVRDSSVPAEQAIAPAQSIEVTAETFDTAAEATAVTTEAEDITAGAADLTAQAEDLTAEPSYDDAMLDMVAAEMAAPDVSDVGNLYDADMDGFSAEGLPPVDSEIVAQDPEPIVVLAEPPTPQPSLQRSGNVSADPSLGSALIANGILRKPGAPASDPLAPIRRMSQAEKIAFFS